MQGPILYPGADHTTQWVGKGSVTMPMDHVKWIVHTTETPSWPSYDYGGVTMGSAPTLTYNPWDHSWRQHFELNQSARALRNDGTFYCNRADVVQTEVICYCDHNLAKQYGHACTSLDAQAIADLGDFGAWLHTKWALSLAFYPETLPWPIYPLGTARMGADAASSVVGPDHQVHDTPGLYVVDGAAVPSSLGVNPQVTIMALATRAAEKIAAALA